MFPELDTPPHHRNQKTCSRFIKAFPTADRLAESSPQFLQQELGVGYRAQHIFDIAYKVASGDLDLEALRPGIPAAISDIEAYTRLLALPGIGPYAAANTMLLMGRYSQPILDSWSRPAYAKVIGKQKNDQAIKRGLARFGPYAGLAFWLMITRNRLNPTPPLSLKPV